MPCCSRRHGEGGASLIEVLVAVLILSFGMLAMGAMQGYAVASSRLAGHRATATLLAAEWADLLRANPQGLAAGGYDLRGYLSDAAGVGPGETAAARCAFPHCTPVTLAAYDMARLKARVRAELPQGGLQLSRPAAAAPAADLWVVWVEPRLLARAETDAPQDAPEKDFDHCPPEARALRPVPRCLYMRVVP